MTTKWTFAINGENANQERERQGYIDDFDGIFD